MIVSLVRMSKENLFGISYMILVRTKTNFQHSVLQFGHNELLAIVDCFMLDIRNGNFSTGTCAQGIVTCYSPLPYRSLRTSLTIEQRYVSAGPRLCLLVWYARCHHSTCYRQIICRALNGPRSKI